MRKAVDNLLYRKHMDALIPRDPCGESAQKLREKVGNDVFPARHIDANFPDRRMCSPQRCWTYGCRRRCVQKNQCEICRDCPYQQNKEVCRMCPHKRQFIESLQATPVSAPGTGPISPADARRWRRSSGFQWVDLRKKDQERQQNEDKIEKVLRQRLAEFKPKYIHRIPKPTKRKAKWNEQELRMHDAIAEWREERGAREAFAGLPYSKIPGKCRYPPEMAGILCRKYDWRAGKFEYPFARPKPKMTPLWNKLFSTTVKDTLPWLP